MYFVAKLVHILANVYLLNKFMNLITGFRRQQLEQQRTEREGKEKVEVLLRTDRQVAGRLTWPACFQQQASERLSSTTAS